MQCCKKKKNSYKRINSRAISIFPPHCTYKERGAHFLPEPRQWECTLLICCPLEKCFLYIQPKRICVHVTMQVSRRAFGGEILPGFRTIPLFMTPTSPPANEYPALALQLHYSADPPLALISVLKSALLLHMEVKQPFGL